MGPCSIPKVYSSSAGIVARGEDLAQKPKLERAKEAYHVEWGVNRVYFYKNGGLMIRTVKSNLKPRG